MVPKPRFREIQGGPPPMDESWWEAIMAEDEAQHTPNSPKSPAYTNSNNRPSTPRPVELPAMDWSKANQLYLQDQSICLQVSGYNRGGLLVLGDGLQGFVPVSHLIESTEEEIDEEKWLKNYLGRTLRLKVIECDQERGRVVFSERAALAEPGSRNYLLQHIKPGDAIPGTVTNITDFGVFVDLGGVEGLIHVSEISWGRVHHPADVVQLGQQVNVHVIHVEKDRARVALSLKRLYPNPWETAEERYYAGQITEAVITSIVPFGAFARLEEGLDGLIHVSEIAPKDGAERPGELLQEGQRVKVRVLHVDGPRQRLGLSLYLNNDTM